MIDQLAPVTETDEMARLESMIGPMMDPSVHLNANWLNRNNWIAVPVESACHFDEHDARLLAQALQAAKVDDCYAIAVEPLESFPHGFEVQPTVEGLTCFSKECSHFNFLLVPASCSCAVLCTVHDYFVVAGPHDFVETVLGCSIAEARARFTDFARDSDESERLLNIARKYEML